MGAPPGRFSGGSSLAGELPRELHVERLTAQLNDYFESVLDVYNQAEDRAEDHAEDGSPFSVEKLKRDVRVLQVQVGKSVNQIREYNDREKRNHEVMLKQTRIFKHMRSGFYNECLRLRHMVSNLLLRLELEGEKTTELESFNTRMREITTFDPMVYTDPAEGAILKERERELPCAHSPRGGRVGLPSGHLGWHWYA